MHTKRIRRRPYNNIMSSTSNNIMIFMTVLLVLVHSSEAFLQYSTKITHSSSSMKLSATRSNAPQFQGKERDEELSRLVNKLKMNSVEDLLRVLKQKRSQTNDDEVNKAEYIDWLLSSTDKDEEATQKQQQQKKAVSLNKEQQQKKASSSKKKQQQSSFLTGENFVDRTDIHPASKRALTEVFKITSMTEIQSKTFEAASSGRDVLGRARTGTGKTLAFLLPAVERILKLPEFLSGDGVGVLVISPTRELASQIADQAEKLLTFHSKNLSGEGSVQVVYGGTKINRDISAFKRRLPTILVATPGRLLDHMQTTVLPNGDRFGRDIMSRTPVLVLDETDRLLDMGFRKEIGKILAYLPQKERRQTLLFSATIPNDLKGIMAQNMKQDFIEVDCINDADEDATSNQIQQSHVIIPTMDRYVSSVVEIIRLSLQKDPEAKIVAFFPTARMVAFFAEFFNEGIHIPVIELHSKKSQSYRNKASEQFRSAERGILFTSDVSARGVDYPGVTQVIQFGIPDTREQYIHRLGRTGRAGADGKGWLVLGPFESHFLAQLKGLNIPRNEELVDLLNYSMEQETQEMLTKGIDKIRNGKGKLQSSAEGAYQAFLGFYLGKIRVIRMRSKEELVSIANEFSRQMGLPVVPSLTKRLVGKMGLKGISGITIGPDVPKSSNNPKPKQRPNDNYDTSIRRPRDTADNGGRRRRPRR